jgi:hypothetical protein
MLVTAFQAADGFSMFWKLPENRMVQVHVANQRIT